MNQSVLIVLLFNFVVDYSRGQSDSPLKQTVVFQLVLTNTSLTL